MKKILTIIFISTFILYHCANTESEKEINQESIQGKWKGYNSTNGKYLSWQFSGNKCTAMIITDNQGFRGTFVTTSTTLSASFDEITTNGGSTWLSSYTSQDFGISFDGDTLVIANVSYTKQ